jgi:hypothetical protein
LSIHEATIVGMTAPGNSAVLLTLLAALVTCTGYAAGRLHQWYRTGVDRDEAYRDGYDTATRSTFSMAARIIGPRRDKVAVRASASVPSAPAAAAPADSPSVAAPANSPSVTPPGPVKPVPFFGPKIVAAPSAADSSPTGDSPDEVASAESGRHFVPDELVRAATYRLAPDRVARAKVHGTTPPSDESPARPAVPKPRAS